MNGIFITGTDTNIGKTVVSAILCKAFQKITSVHYWKPIQSGASEGSDTEMVGTLVGSGFLAIDPVYNLQAPMSPNRSAELEGVNISAKKIYQRAKDYQESFCIVEGAGGCLVPINETETILDCALELEIPLVVVASTQLGTINHTLLTWKMLVMKGLNPQALFLVGPEDPGLTKTLKQYIDIPHLVEVPQLEFVSEESLGQFVSESKRLKEFCSGFFAKDAQQPDIIKKDKDFVWHPFTQHGTSKDLPEVLSGKGAFLRTAEGQTLFDGISSWWVNLHGHGHPKIAENICRQAHQLEHVIFAGFTHRPAVQLVETLIGAAQKRGCLLERGFFSDNGSTAVEVALKMAFQYHQNRGDKKRRRFLSLKGSYHGDTIGAMSVGARGYFHEPFEPLMFPVESVEPDDFEALERALSTYGKECAAFILEPMVQGAGGMRFYSAEFLNRVGELCKTYGVLTIADEIFTGFYRTGKLFAFEHSQWRPDLLCLSKGLTGGFLPMSLTLATGEVFEAFKSDETRRAFLHGHSYTANPIACQAGLASWSLLHETATQERIQEISRLTKQYVTALGSRKDVSGARCLGTLGAFEVGEGEDYFSGDFSGRFHQAAKKKGLLLRPLGSTVYTLPPYCATSEDIDNLYDKLTQVLDEARSWQ